MTTALLVTLDILLVITSLALVALILLHRGTGGGLSDMFGGGLTSGAAGSARASRNLDLLTLAVGGVWLASVIAVGLLV